MSGTYICSGAVIGAESVVSGFIPPYEIWAGNPARFIKRRFTRKEINKLLDIAWWNWTEEKIKKYVPLLLNTNVSQFIKTITEENK